MPNDNIERAIKRGSGDNGAALNVYSNFELPAQVLERIAGQN